MHALALVLVMMPGSGSMASRLESIAAGHINVLADPAMEGRMTLREGNKRAAAFIEKTYRNAGLQPLNGSYRHAFSVTIGERPTKNNFARVEGEGNKSVSLAMGKDYVPLTGSKAMRMASGSGVYFGSMAPTGDLSGRVAILLRAGTADNPIGARVSKAKELGASGVVIVGPSGEGRRELPLWNRGSGIAANLELVGIGMTREAFKKVSGIDPSGTVTAPKETGLRFRMVTELEPNTGTSENVIGVLPGTDPALKNEYIIIGGHFDHLGYGETGSRSGSDLLHNGADDNASGTGGVMALAQVLAESRAIRRTIIFQAYSGEEVGLVGAVAWVRDHPEIIKNTQAMLNMDMIGRLRDGGLGVSCVGSAADFKALLDGISVEGIKPRLNTSSPPNSDHAAFIRANVPALFLNTGLHDEYHTHNDNVDTLNYEGIGQILEYARQIVLKWDAEDKRYTFVAQPGSTRPEGSGSGDPNSSRRVRVGFIPDMSDGDGKPGMMVSGVTPGSPAELAGVKAGDRLLEFDGKPVNNIEDLQGVLMAAKAGVTIKVVILRGNERLTLNLTPAASQ